MKVVIVGGTGLLSSSITKMCLEKGYEVIHFNRGTKKKVKNVKSIVGNRYDKDSLKKIALEKPNVVIDMLCFQPSDAKLSIEVLKGKIEQYIYCSSSCVYTPEVSCKIKYENSETNPVIQYGIDKLGAEKVFLKAMEDNMFSVSIFRPGHVFGKDFLVNNLTYDGKYVLSRMIRNEDVFLTDQGKRKFQACHADNIGRAFAECCGNQNTFGEIYNIAGEEILDWQEIYNIEKNILESKSRILSLNSKDVIKCDRNSFDYLNIYTKYDWVQSTEKLKNDLRGYHYHVNFEKGIGQFIRKNWEQLQTCRTEEKLYKKLYHMI